MINELVLSNNYLTIGKPRPVPSQFMLESSVNFSSNINFKFSVGIPFPLSLTSIVTYCWLSFGLQPTNIQFLFKISKSNYSIFNKTSTYPNWVCFKELDIKLLTILFTFILWTYNLDGNPFSDTNLKELLPFLANLEWVLLNPMIISTLSNCLLTSLTSIKWCDLNSILKLSNMSVRSSSSLLQHSFTTSQVWSWSFRVHINADTGFFKSWTTFITLMSFFLLSSSAIWSRMSMYIYIYMMTMKWKDETMIDKSL